MDASPRPNVRLLLYGLAMGALAVATLAAAGGLRAIFDVWVPVASIMAGLLLASVPFAGRLAAWAGVPRTGAVAALSTIAIAPLLVLGALYALGDPIVSSHFRCGTADIGIMMLAPFVFGLAGTTGALLAVVVAGRGRRWVDASVRGLALVASGLAAALLTWSIARAAFHPGPDSYVASLPVVATIPPVTGAPVEHIPGNPDNYPSPRDVYRDPIPGAPLTLERRCEDTHCSFGFFLADGGSAPASGEGGVIDHGTVARDKPVTLRRDAAHDLWIAEGSSTFAFRRGSAWREVSGDPEPQRRESGAMLTLLDINVSDVSDALSPPPGWIVGAAGGLVIAALAAARRRRASSRLGRIASARAGTLGENGWIAFEGDTPAVRAAPDLGLPAGPVLVFAPEGGKAPEGAYRGETPLGKDAIIAGDREEASAPIRAERAAADALSLAAAVLTAAPLVAAWIVM